VPNRSGWPAWPFPEIRRREPATLTSFRKCNLKTTAEIFIVDGKLVSCVQRKASRGGIFGSMHAHMYAHIDHVKFQVGF
jgi:hypothetical protein